MKRLTRKLKVALFVAALATMTLSSTVMAMAGQTTEFFPTVDNSGLFKESRDMPGTIKTDETGRTSIVGIDGYLTTMQMAMPEGAPLYNTVHVTDQVHKSDEGNSFKVIEKITQTLPTVPDTQLGGQKPNTGTIPTTLYNAETKEYMTPAGTIVSINGGRTNENVSRVYASDFETNGAYTYESDKEVAIQFVPTATLGDGTVPIPDFVLEHEDVARGIRSYDYMQKKYGHNYDRGFDHEKAPLNLNGIEIMRIKGTPEELGNLTVMAHTVVKNEKGELVENEVAIKLPTFGITDRSGIKPIALGRFSATPDDLMDTENNVFTSTHDGRFIAGTSVYDANGKQIKLGPNSDNIFVHHSSVDKVYVINEAETNDGSVFKIIEIDLIFDEYAHLPNNTLFQAPK